MSFKPFTILIDKTPRTFTKPVVMGILNITPDSFYDGPVNLKTDFLHRAESMLKEGAAIIDMGGQSTRPGAERLSVDEEWSRIAGKIEAIRKEFPESIVSIDTFYGTIAERAANEGAQIINDVSAGSIDPSIIQVASNLRLPYVLMHMQGEPQTMQNNPQYSDIIQEEILFLSEKINELTAQDVNDIIIDPGFGFGKTQEHNFELLQNLGALKILERPILVGVSRKKMIQRAIEKEAQEALNGTTAANTIAALKGASILRVHDVAAAADALAIVRQLT
ncbi:MAG: dihydropteroate synthase [Flavobacteriales bacterium]